MAPLSRLTRFACFSALLCTVGCAGNSGTAANGHADGGDAASSEQDAGADQASPGAVDAGADAIAIHDASSDVIADAGIGDAIAVDSTVTDAAARDSEAADVVDSGIADATTTDAASDATTTDAASDATTTDATSDATTTDAAPSTAYVTLQATGGLAVFAADADGGLAPSSGSPFGTGGISAFSVTGNRAGTRLYAGVLAASGAASVAAFTLGAEGQITGTPSGSPFATGVTAAPTRVVVNPVGTRLYVVHQGAAAGSIAVFALDATGNVGALRSGSPFGTGTGTYAASVNPAGTRLYVTSQEKQGVYVFALDANGDVTGQTAGSPFLTGIDDAPLLSVVHPSGGRLYVTDQGDDIVVFTLDANGDVTGQQTGSPFVTTSTASATVGLAVNAAGTRLYVGTNGSALDVFTLDGATGDVRGAAAPFTVGGTTYDVAENAAQTDLFVIDSNAGRVASVTLDANGDPQSVVKAVLDGGSSPSAVWAR